MTEINLSFPSNLDDGYIVDKIYEIRQDNIPNTLTGIKFCSLTNMKIPLVKIRKYQSNYSSIIMLNLMIHQIIMLNLMIHQIIMLNLMIHQMTYLFYI